MQFLLRSAPALLFDKKQWSQFAAAFRSADIALARMSAPPFPPLGFHRPNDIGIPRSANEYAKHCQSAFALGMTLVGKFKSDLITGFIVATGIPLPKGNRQHIPAADWRRLWPNFADGSALGELFGYADVRLRMVKSRKPVNSRLIKACADWLRTFDLDDLPIKKTLQRRADAHFRQPIPTRVFNEAYRRVAHRGRGRPARRAK